MAQTARRRRGTLLVVAVNTKENKQMNGKWNVRKDGKITIHEFHDNALKRVTIKIVQNNLEKKTLIHVFCLRYKQGEVFGFFSKHDNMGEAIHGSESIAETYDGTTTRVACGVDDINLKKNDTVYLVLDDRYINKGDRLYRYSISYYLIVEEKIQEMMNGSLYKLKCEKIFDVDDIRTGSVLKIKRS